MLGERREREPRRERDDLVEREGDAALGDRERRDDVPTQIDPRFLELDLRPGDERGLGVPRPDLRVLTRRRRAERDDGEPDGSRRPVLWTAFHVS
jgi:hypothetical protein